MSDNDSYFLLGDIANFLDSYHQTSPFFYGSSDSGFIKDKAYTFDVGIAEHNLIGIASGLALKGNKVIVSSISSFLLQNSYLVLKNIVSYYDLDIIMIGIGAGMSYSKLGHTHHNLDDIGYINLLPNMKILLPADSNELIEAIKYAYVSGGCYYIRVGTFRGRNFSLPFIGAFDDVNKKIFGTNKDILLISYGQLLHDVIEVADQLAKENIYSSIMNFNSMNNFSVDIVKEVLSQYKYIFVIEEHFENSGVGNWLLSNGIQNVCIRGVKKNHIDICGDTDFLRNQVGLGKEDIYEFIISNREHA